MSDIDEQDERIAEILAGHGTLSVNQKTLSAYLAYLQENIDFPCYLTGIEDFPWEERYVFGFGDPAEYERLKKTQPSYQDTFELLRFDEEISEDYGIFVRVKRVSDKRRFDLPLTDLEATERESPNSQLLDDFSVWYVNYR